jgi:hypothetical protein
MAVKQKGYFVAAFLVVFTTAFISFGLLSHPVAADTYPIPASGNCNDTDTKSTDGKTCTTGTTGDTTDKDNKDDASTNTTTCAVEKIGWIVCPVLEQAAKLSDKTFGVLADNFLRTDPQLISNQSGTKVAWEIARNIANIMFIITFLIIIVSQVTSMGINNYGIKKMLPRLIIAAIAVNVSYYICQLAVDVTNILGYEIQNMLTDVANSIGPSVFGNASQYGVTQAQNGWGNFLSVITVTSLAIAGVVWLVMGPMVAVITMVAITALTIVVILLLRKAVIVLLIVISPIAIVLYLLPNTEKLFSKWMRMFTQILMVFPVVGLLFGAGQLASTIVLVAGSQTDDQVIAARDCNPEDKDVKDKFKADHPTGYAECGVPAVSVQGPKDGKETPCTGAEGAKAGSGCKRTVGVMTGLIAVGIAIAPLIAVWAVLKGALSAAGAIGGKITSTVTKGTGGLNKRAQANDEARQNRMALRGMQDRPGGIVGARYRKRAERDAERKGVKDELGRATNRYLSREAAAEDSKLADRMAGGSLLRGATPDAIANVQRAADASMRSDLAAAVKDAMPEIELKAPDELMDIIQAAQTKGGAFSPQALAALQQITHSGDPSQIRNAVVASSGDKEAARVMGQALASDNPGYFGAADLASITRGDVGNDTAYNDMVGESLRNGTVTAAKMASMNNGHLDFARQIAESGHGGAAAVDKLMSAAESLKTNAAINGSVGKQVGALNNILSSRSGSGTSGTRF